MSVVSYANQERRASPLYRCADRAIGFVQVSPESDRQNNAERNESARFRTPENTAYSAAKNANVKAYRTLYLPMIFRRCVLCLKEYTGARICRDGRSQNSIVACSRSMYGIKIGTVSINSL